jgi:putative addiction module killer protein
MNGFELIRTDEFNAWLIKLRDRRGVVKIGFRLARLEQGILGDVKPVGDGVSEIRIDHGPGYRLYYVKRGLVIIVLLCGGDKSSQDRDIARAKLLAEQWKG